MDLEIIIVSVFIVEMSMIARRRLCCGSVPNNTRVMS